MQSAGGRAEVGSGPVFGETERAAQEVVPFWSRYGL